MNLKINNVSNQNSLSSKIFYNACSGISFKSFNDLMQVFQHAGIKEDK